MMTVNKKPTVPFTLSLIPSFTHDVLITTETFAAMDISYCQYSVRGDHRVLQGYCNNTHLHFSIP